MAGKIRKKMFYTPNIVLIEREFPLFFKNTQHTINTMVHFKLLAAFLLVRIASVFVVKTWFVPDEYWQSLEVGHKLAFGYGHLTWEWSKGIRSYIHPLCITGVYQALAWFGLDQVDYLILVPRILQAILSAISDYCFYKWCDRSKWAIFLIITSWFWFYTASRTLINTLETCLTTIALSLYPRHHGADAHAFLWIVAVTCFIRPTAAILWLPLCIIHMRKSAHSIVELLVKRYLLIGMIVGAAAVALDSYAHGSFIVTPVEFVRANILDGIAGFYGTHPWYWNVAIGLPTILGPITLPFVLALVQTVRNRDTYRDRFNLLITIVFTLLVYSLLPHKEFRFLLPLLPICLNITVAAISNWSRSASGWLIWFVALLLLVTNALPAVYLSWQHQRGTTDAMITVERIAREYRDPDGHPAKFLFLMPCHSTPFYSHVHQNVSMRFLTCEPNFNGLAQYKDEADQFYANPAAWLRSHIPVYPKSAMPTHTILFDSLAPSINEFLKGYQLVESFNHTDYVTDHRVGNKVLLYEHKRTLVKPTEAPNLFNEQSTTAKKQEL